MLSHETFSQMGRRNLGSLNAFWQRFIQDEELIEPFVGSGAVFLRSSYEHYPCDVNPHLIKLYNSSKPKAKALLIFAKPIFILG